MSPFRSAVVVATFLISICSNVRADYQVISVHINDDTAKMNVSNGTSFAFAKAMAQALQTHDINHVTLTISENGSPDDASRTWVHIVVDDLNVGNSQNAILVSVSPDTPIAFVSALSDTLTAVDGRPVRFISKKTFDAFVSQSTAPSSQSSLESEIEAIPRKKITMR